MRNSVILAIVEPLNYSLDKSLAWDLIKQLRAGEQPLVQSSGSQNVGTLVGAIPILQPIRARLINEGAFIIMMRGIIDSATGDLSSTHSLVDKQGNLLAAMTADPTQYPLAFMVAASSLGAASLGGLEPLRNFVQEMAGELWGSEPITWTTHALQLAATGQFLSGQEMIASKLSAGELVSSNGIVSVVPGAATRGIAYRGWKNAGVNSVARIPVGGSGETCTYAGGSSEGGDWGSGSGGVDSGPGSGGAGGGGASGGGDSGGAYGCEVKTSKIQPAC